MESWQELLRKKSLASLDALVAKFGPEHFPDLERLRQAALNFEFRISPAMVDLIQSPGDPIWRQYVPDLQELDVRDGLVDSLAEDAHSPVPNITHRYPDRALFLVSPVCASYCRFCTRRRKVGDPEKISMRELESAFRYLAAHTEIRDVIMSGGDPLLLSDRRIDELCRRLRAIPHLEILRIGSRAGTRHARRRRHSARLSDRPPEGRERRPRGHEAPDAATPRRPGAALLHLHVRPGRRRRALSHQRRKGARDHPRAARVDLGPRRAPLRDRRSRRRRQDPALARIRRVAHRRRRRAAKLRRPALRVPAARPRGADPRRLIAVCGGDATLGR